MGLLKHLQLVHMIQDLSELSGAPVLKMNADMSHSFYNQVYAMLWIMGPGYTVSEKFTHLCCITCHP